VRVVKGLQGLFGAELVVELRQVVAVKGLQGLSWAEVVGELRSLSKAEVGCSLRVALELVLVV